MYCILVHFIFCGVYILQIMTFSNFHMFIFTDGEVLSLHKSLI